MAWEYSIARDAEGRLWVASRLDGDPHTDSIRPCRVATVEEAARNLVQKGWQVQVLSQPRPAHWGGPMISGPGPVEVLLEAWT